MVLCRISKRLQFHLTKILGRRDWWIPKKALVPHSSESIHESAFHFDSDKINLGSILLVFHNHRHLQTRHPFNSERRFHRVFLLAAFLRFHFEYAFSDRLGQLRDKLSCGLHLPILFLRFFSAYPRGERGFSND